MMLRAIFAFTVILAGCCLIPDPYGCRSRGKLEIPDVYLVPGFLGQEYTRELKISSMLAHISIEDQYIIALGLELVESEQGYFLTGVPHTAGDHKVKATGREYSTQCPGRGGEFEIHFSIFDPAAP